MTHQTVGKWYQRFVEQWLDGLLDEARPKRRAKLVMHRERVVRMTLERTLADATHWSTRAMARRSGLSQTMVSHIWRAFALQPHWVEGVKLPKDQLFVEKGRDIAGLYLNPLDPALVLCVDEKARIRALDRSQPTVMSTSDNRTPTSTCVDLPRRPVCERWRKINRARSRTWARGERAFRVVKHLRGFAEAKYRGLAKPGASADHVFARQPLSGPRTTAPSRGQVYAMRKLHASSLGDTIAAPTFT